MITLTEVPASPGGILGNLFAICNLQGQTLPVSPVGDRNIAEGTALTTGWSPSQTDATGTLVGTFNTATGVWTCPATGWYNISLLFSIAIDIGPFNNLVSNDNINGFIGNLNSSIPPPPLQDPSSSYNLDPTITPLSFYDYFGSFGACITDFSGGTIVCVAQQVLTYNTSVVQLSASYVARKIINPVSPTPPKQFVCRYLNKGKNNIKGQIGNSFHIAITHIA